MEAVPPNPDRSIWHISRSILVGASDEEGREHVLNSPFGESLVYMRGMRTICRALHVLQWDADMPEDALDVQYIIDKIAIFRSVDTVPHELQEGCDITGDFGTALVIVHDWDDRAMLPKSMELFTKEIMPQLPWLE